MLPAVSRPSAQSNLEVKGDRVNPKESKDRPAREGDARSVMISKLLHNVAHDIRTPTTAVRGYIRMLLEGRVGAVTPDQKECLEVVLRSAIQLATLGNTVSEAGEILGELNVETLDVRELWSRACDVNRPKALAKGATIKERIPSDPVLASGDRGSVAAILEGTLAHAIEGMESGSEVRVELSGDSRTDATLRIELPRSSSQLDAARNESFLKLRNQVFLNGGTLTVGNKGEQAVFTISLPGCSI
jgi:signal transduction histidine kinase